ncbi:hypothetical protein J5N97_013511 [Dioscorea zingiberensis]|uniref:Uncharacterized protein n=1 Tax=Dioscorea zingiberensis TaxID=325984 RepID=A0A9D5CS97_9LILI|nr:hypothetical protein J5N97_013511 [Dioscorea zingiberensis]
MEELILKYMQNNDTTIQNLQATVQNLENQIGQIAKTLSERPQGSMLGNTEENPRGEQCKDITLRSWKEVELPVLKPQDKTPIEVEDSEPGDNSEEKKKENKNIVETSLIPPYQPKNQKPTGITLQLANRSVRQPMGFAEDVLVLINQFVFPADYVLLDVYDDIDVPIIPMRSFLATAQALEDHAKGRLALGVGDQEVVFKLPDAIRHTMAQDDTFIVLMTSTLSPPNA